VEEAKLQNIGVTKQLLEKNDKIKQLESDLKVMQD